MKRMLFNATQQEELRVAIVDGQRLIDIDIETAGREQRKGNIYKGVITRVEPSLEACFVNYGEERHGFLPFKEIAKSYFKPGVDSRANLRDLLSEGQEIIVQVEKEERSNKGAALTSFISLAGRYLVLMPNNPRGGGVSRRIEGDDRQELREAMAQLAIPEGMSIIARTAGIGRAASELQWDLNYLTQLWKAIDEAAHAHGAPQLIYLESSLVIRAIRDYFQPDIGEILIDTDDVFEQAHAFMSVVMPDNMTKVKRYSDDVPLFSRFQIEHQIETAYSRTVSLPSGGAIVIDHTEALVSIDVNSARATRGADIEETAARTNLEAAEEISRQLRLRDLGGLIVIDFIDMESAKAQKDVEQRLKDALHYDRARVQMGKISRFGLMELSRQRLRPALSEGSHITCPRCNGTGHIRDAESSALQVLRIIQEEAMKEHTAAIYCQVPVEVAAFLLNEKRSEIIKTEARFKVNVVLIPNKHLETPHYKLERLRHDDPRLDESQASYRMAEEAARELEADTSYGKRTEVVKPRQEAAVKSIRPEQPAPISTRPAKKGEAKGGLFSWITKLFSSAEPQAVAKPAPAKRHQDTRSRGGNNETQQRGQRNNKNNRNTARILEGQEDTRGASEGRHNTARQADGGRNADASRNGGREENRNNNNRQRQRQRSELEIKATAPVSAALVTPVEKTGEPGGSSSVHSANEERRGSRNRRGRGRNNRGDASSQEMSAIVADTNEVAISLAVTPATAAELAPTVMPTRVEKPRAEELQERREERNAKTASSEAKRTAQAAAMSKGAAVSAGAAANTANGLTAASEAFLAENSLPQAAIGAGVAAAPVVERVKAVDVKREIESAIAPISAASEYSSEPSAAPVSVATGVPSSGAVQKGVSTESVSTAHVPTTVAPLAPTAVSPAPTIAKLEEVVNSSGLVWVQTDKSKVSASPQAAVISTPVAPAPAPRRRKPAPPVAEGPMVMVETGQDKSE